MHNVLSEAIYELLQLNVARQTSSYVIYHATQNASGRSIVRSRAA